MITKQTKAAEENTHVSLSILRSHLFDFGNIPDEGVIVHKVQKLLQLVQVADVVLTNPLRITCQRSSFSYSN